MSAPLQGNGRQYGDDLTRLWLGEETADRLWNAGFRTVDALENALESELLSIPQIGPGTVAKIRKRVAEMRRQRSEDLFDLPRRDLVSL